MKAEVYSWRLSSDLKSKLERHARSRKTSVSAIIEMATREWMKKNEAETPGDQEEQAKLHAEAARWIGAIAGGNPRRAETAREGILGRLRRRYGR